ncbi:uncharacterized protein LOC144700044 [Wolffia australiana]
MAGSRAREESDSFQLQGSKGVVTKRNLARRFVDRAPWLLDRRGKSRSIFSRGGGGGVGGGKKPWAIVRAVILFILIFCAVGGFVLLAALLHRATDGGGGGSRRWREMLAGDGGTTSKFGGGLRFLPSGMLRRFDERGGLDRIRSEPRLAVRPPRLAVVLGRMEKDSSSLLMFTLVKYLREIGYHITVFAAKDGKARPRWEQVAGQISILSRDNNIDWSIFEGLILSSIEARIVMNSLMHEPLDDVPVIWIIHDSTLGERLSLYKEMDWQLIISDWRKAFSRADVVVFPDSSLPVLYTAVDTGNFFLIPGSPFDVWVAETYGTSHSKVQLRRENGFHELDCVVLVVGSSFVYDNDTRDYDTAMHFVGPTLSKFAQAKNMEGSFKVIVLSGKYTEVDNSAFQDSDLGSQFGFPRGCVKRCAMDGDVNRALIIADIVVYISFLDEQTFPSLLTRAMSFGVLVVAPDLSTIKRYVRNNIDGFIFQSRNAKSFSAAFSLATAELSSSNRTVATSGKNLSKNMLSNDCIIGYAKLLENVVPFPSDVLLPEPIDELRSYHWEWGFLQEESEKMENGDHHLILNVGGASESSSIVFTIEEELTDGNVSQDTSNQNETAVSDYPSNLDWEDIREMEFLEDIEMLEAEELLDRTERPWESWEDVYSRTRKVSKMKVGNDEREDEELEKVGQHVTIYEIYSGAGAWPFLHHGVLYRSVSLSTEAEGSRMGDVRAVLRLPLLNITYYRDILCEYGGILAIANKLNSIHKTPWIGFHSWHAVGRKVSLTLVAERSLEQILRKEANGDVFYFWATTDMGSRNTNGKNVYDFWSICDTLNNGHCRDMFQGAFRTMYCIPSGVPSLPPMPDGRYWSALHSWVMSTPSFLEFVMFSRIFLESLDSLNNKACLLGSSRLEKKHCYCRLMELLVNVWVYHSGRKMVYINPQSGELKEQQPVDLRRGLMWTGYFNSTLLRSMEEDLAEATEDRIYPRKGFLWPLTGEVFCQLILEKEKELRYRLKREKNRKDKEKQLERKRIGRIQKPLG